MTRTDTDPFLEGLRRELARAMAEAAAFGIVFEPDDERGLPEDLREEAAALREGWRSVCGWIDAMKRFGAKLPERQARDWVLEMEGAESWVRDGGPLLDSVAFWRRYYLGESPKIATMDGRRLG